MSKFENNTEQVPKWIYIVGGIFLFFVVIVILWEQPNSSSSSEQSYTQSNTISNANDVQNCIRHRTFRNRSVQGEISFTSEQFNYQSGRPVDVAWGYFEVNSSSSIRLIRAQQSSRLPANISVIDCNTLSISGRSFTR